MANISDIQNIIEELMTPIIEKTIRRVIKEEMIQVLKPEEKDDILSFDQALKFLQISSPKLYGLTSKKTIPFMKKDNKLYFSREELTEWILEGRIKTNKEIEEEAERFITRHRLPITKKPKKATKINIKMQTNRA